MGVSMKSDQLLINKKLLGSPLFLRIHDFWTARSPYHVGRVVFQKNQKKRLFSESETSAFVRGWPSADTENTPVSSF